MNMNKAAFGAAKARVVKMLPDDVDPEVVKEFFANTKSLYPEFDTAPEKAKANLRELAPPFAAKTEADGMAPDVDSSGIPVLTPMSGCACPKENQAQTDADALTAQSEPEIAPIAEPEDDAGINPADAAAKGGWKVKGPDSDGTDGGGKGNGRGKKNETQEETTDETPTTSDPAPAPTTEDPVTNPEPAPEEAPAPDPAPAPEEDTASDPTPDPTPDPEQEAASDPEPAPEDPAPEQDTAPESTGSNNYITDAADHVTGQDAPDGFKISIDFVGQWTETQKMAFIVGAETVSDIVVGDLPDADGIDDMHITAVSKAVSGWAYGGPRSVHEDSGLTKTGEVTFNSANLSAAENYGVVDDFAFHEILHAMGVGTHWGGGDLVENAGGEVRFTGQNAIEAYNDPDGIYADLAAGDEFSFLGVPLDAGANHLNESYFGADMMTPTLSTNNVISDLTIAMLEDIGYDTIYGDAPAADLVYDDPLLV